jgi:hypothetical protein
MVDSVGVWIVLYVLPKRACFCRPLPAIELTCALPPILQRYQTAHSIQGIATKERVVLRNQKQKPMSSPHRHRHRILLPRYRQPQLQRLESQRVDYWESSWVLSNAPMNTNRNSLPNLYQHPNNLNQCQKCLRPFGSLAKISCWI